MTKPCAHCGRPVTYLAASEISFPIYHGDCWRIVHPPQGGAIHLMSHEERIQEGLERP